MSRLNYILYTIRRFQNHSDITRDVITRLIIDLTRLHIQQGSHLAGFQSFISIKTGFILKTGSRRNTYQHILTFAELKSCRIQESYVEVTISAFWSPSPVDVNHTLLVISIKHEGMTAISFIITRIIDTDGSDSIPYRYTSSIRQPNRKNGSAS